MSMIKTGGFDMIESQFATQAVTYVQGIADQRRPNTRRPLYRKRTYRKPAIYRVGGMLIVHPEIMRNVRRQIERNMEDAMDSLFFGSTSTATEGRQAKPLTREALDEMIEKLGPMPRSPLMNLFEPRPLHFELEGFFMSETFAVRWARRELKRMFTMDYTKWHASQDGNMFTFCGLAVPIGLAGTFLPETDSNINKVSCRKCLRLLTQRPPDSPSAVGSSEKSEESASG